MKLLPSPSISSSTSTFDAHVCNPGAAASPSCFSGVLRRILCSGSLPTHPSDHIAEETNSVKSENKPSAGIVARLMGLDPMPEMNSIARKQSISSVEHFYKHLEGKDGAVRSKVSFREIPTFLELQTEDYFIFSFEGGTKSKEFRATELRSKQRKEEEVKFKNRGSNKTEQHSVRKTEKTRFNPDEAKEFVRIDLKQKKEPWKFESESSSSSDELISPVSVLESSQFLRDPTQLSGDNTSSKFPFKSRRKLSPELDDGLIINEGNSSKTKVIYNGVQLERFEEAITVMELSGSNWKFGKICEEHEEFGVGGIIEGFDSYILEGLIEEFVEQMYDSIFV